MWGLSHAWGWALAPAFNLDSFLTSVDPRLLEDAEGRRLVSRLSPLWFALIYLPHHLKNPDTGEITFAELHLDLIEHARTWLRPDAEPLSGRDGYVAPRECGKSTWLFTILPLWAAAHGHKRFCAAFADSGSQAEMHLKTFTGELESNQLLRNDFPDLCTPAVRPRGVTAADNRNLYMAKSGFVFSAKGIDSSTLGMKVGNARPDLIILDDIEPTASNYSPYQKEQRLRTIREAVFPMNLRARVLIVGTVSIPGSVIDELVKAAKGENTASWIAEEKIRPHYYPAILTDPETGTERSIWSAKWPLPYLQSMRHARSFQSQFMNNVLAIDGSYWTMDDFTYRSDVPLTSQVLSIDPAVTSKEKSDFTALAVVGHSVHANVSVVRAVWNLKIPPGAQLRERVLSILDLYPETMGVLIETNQGGEVWEEILHDLPVRLNAVHQSAAKELRAERLLNHYQFKRVVHERRLPQLEEQMVAFPKGAHDDLVDAVGTAVEALRPRPKTSRGQIRQASYM